MRRARVIVADCAWKFGDRLPGKKRGAAKHYRVMTLADLCLMELPPLQQDAILFFWRVGAMQREALAVIRAWGFSDPKSELIWLKRTSGGERHFGMGRYVRNEHEVCLIATRGRFKVSSHSVRSTFAARVGAHSAKPKAFYDLVEQLAGHGPYVELFARRQRRGWRCLGNELPKRTVFR